MEPKILATPKNITSKLLTFSVKGVIVETSGKAAGSSWDNSHPRLIDKMGLDGDCLKTQIHCEYCAVSKENNQGGRPWLSVKLESPGRVAVKARVILPYYQG